MTEATTPATLADCRILVAGVLAGAGAEVLGPVPTVADALRLVAAEGRIEGALLDASLHGEAIWPVVDALLACNVPMVLATGYDAGALPDAYARLPRCEKQTSGRDLIRALARALPAQCPVRG